MDERVRRERPSTDPSAPPPFERARAPYDEERDELIRWFEHMDHVMQHTRVPAEQLAHRHPPTPDYGDSGRHAKGGARGAFMHRDHGVEDPGNPFGETGVHGGGEGGGARFSETPTLSYAHFNFSCHVVEVGPKVLETFEQAIEIFSRPVAGKNASSSGEREPGADGSAGDASVQYHVDARVMSMIVDSLVEELELLDSYTLVILNPRKSLLGGRYGYRQGFSAEEMAELRPQRSSLLREARRRGGPKPKPPPPAPSDKSSRGYFDFFHRPGHKFAARDLTYEGGEWAAKLKGTLDSARAARQLDGSLGGEAISVLTGNDAGAAKRLAAALEGGVGALSGEAMAVMRGERGAAERLEAAKGRAKNAAGFAAAKDHEEDCLTDLYVGTARASFIDLSAGPFSWGPLVGGEGLRGPLDVPDVDLRFGHLPGEALKKPNEKPLEAELESMADSHFEAKEIDPDDEVAYMAAEMDVYEMFAKKHCEFRTTRIKLCEELKERVKDLAVAQAEAKGGDVRPRDADFSIFGSDDVSTNVSLAHDLFLSELGRVLSAYLAHAVTPSAAPGAFRYHPKVNVLVYMLSLGGGAGASGTWGGRSSGSLSGGMGGGGFDADALRDELRALMLPGQQLQLSVQRLSVTDDPALAVALSSALRTASSPSLGPDGDVEARRVHWVDSAELRKQLSAVNKAHHRAGRDASESAGARGVRTLEVPVFVLEPDLSVNSDVDVPLLIDEEHQAKSLEDMVLVVQSAVRAWDSPHACNGREIRWNLRDPIKAAVAAVTEHIGGVLPSHVNFNIPRGRVEEDWLWSVGAHPFSATAAGTSLARSHHDAVHRTYALTALDASAARVNAGVAALAATDTHADSWELMQHARSPMHRLAQEYNAVVELWRRVVEAVGKLDFAEAVKHVDALETRADAFKAHAMTVKAEMHPVRCTKRRRLRVTTVHWSVLATSLVLAALYRQIKPGRLKPKVN